MIRQTQICNFDKRDRRWDSWLQRLSTVWHGRGGYISINNTKTKWILHLFSWRGECWGEKWFKVCSLAQSWEKTSHPLHLFTLSFQLLHTDCCLDFITHCYHDSTKVFLHQKAEWLPSVYRIAPKTLNFFFTHW